MIGVDGVVALVIHIEWEHPIKKLVVKDNFREYPKQGVGHRHSSKSRVGPRHAYKSRCCAQASWDLSMPLLVTSGMNVSAGVSCLNCQGNASTGSVQCKGYRKAAISKHHSLNRNLYMIIDVLTFFCFTFLCMVNLRKSHLSVCDTMKSTFVVQE